MLYRRTLNVYTQGRTQRFSCYKRSFHSCTISIIVRKRGQLPLRVSVILFLFAVAHAALPQWLWIAIYQKRVWKFDNFYCSTVPWGFLLILTIMAALVWMRIGSSWKFRVLILTVTLDYFLTHFWASECDYPLLHINLYRGIVTGRPDPIVGMHLAWECFIICSYTVREYGTTHFDQEFLLRWSFIRFSFVLEFTMLIVSTYCETQF